MKVFAGLKLYPSGFLGAPTEYREAHIKKPIQIDIAGSATRRITLESDENTITPNVTIDEIYKKATSDATTFGQDFLFREHFYHTVMNAFGTTTITDWVLRQKENPYFDTMQNRFLEETVEFVYTGHRRYHPSAYMDIIDMGTNNAFAMGPGVRKLFPQYQHEPITIRDFMQSWLSQPDGLSDMLISTRIMFGT